MKIFVRHFIFVFILIHTAVFAQALNPDAVYPVPENFGDKNYEGINLFNGSINLPYELATIKGQNLSYTVSVFYNSRSSILFNQNNSNRVDNSIGGLGWKLMDYYKIVYDANKNQYFLLDGQGQVPLTLKSQSGNSYTYTAGGKYCLWQITIQPNNKTAVSVSDDGTKYFYSGITASNITTYNISKIDDATGTDSLKFVYNNNGSINSIQNKFNESLRFTYSNNLLTQVVFYTNIQGSGSVQMLEAKLAYTGYSYKNTSYKLLSSIKYYSDPDLIDGVTTLEESNPGWNFKYYKSGFPLSLETVTSPLDKRTTYNYYAQPDLPFNYIAASTIKEEFLTNTKLTTVEYSPKNSRLSPDSIYAYFNESTVFPGSSINTSVFNGYFTSFEEEKLKNDPLIGDDDDAETSTDYAHSGKRSLKFIFKNYVLYLPERTVKSKKLLINRFSGNAADSLTISYYWYGPSKTGKVCGYRINATLNFYDKDDKSISGNWKNEIMYHCDNYGQQWNYYSYTVAPPQNAVKVSFSIKGGSTDYGIFYVDDLKLSGSLSSRAGKIVTKFLNATPKDSLKDLPADYYSTYSNVTPLQQYFSGFETGKKDEWLKFGPNAPPQFVESGYNNIISFEGDYALKLKSNKRDKQSLVYLKNPITAPANSQSFVLSFQYTRPEISSTPMSLGVNITINGNRFNITIPLTGSYDSDKRYYSFLANYPVATGQAVQCSLFVYNGDENYALIDNLSMQFVNLNGSTIVNTTMQDSGYIGRSYSTRVFKRDDSEIGSSFSYYTVHNSPLNTTNKYIQLNTSTLVKRGAARNPKQIIYNNEGFASSVYNMNYVRRLNDKTKQDTAWNKIDILYAYQQYPALGINGSNRLKEIALSSNTVSTDYGKTWEIVSVDYSQWGKWNTDGIINNSSGTIWAPWRNFVLKQPISQSQLTSDLSSFASKLNFTPSTANWINVNTVTKINKATLDEISSYNLDTLITNYTFSTGNNGSGYKQEVVPIVQFYNDDALPSYYFGFEAYEAAKSKSMGTTNHYAHTGAQSQQAGFTTIYYCKNGSDTTKKFIISGWALALSNGISLRIAYRINNLPYRYYYPPSISAGNWQYFEHVFTLPANSDSIEINCDGSVNGSMSSNLFMDDIRIGPVDAVFSADVYDMTRMLVTASLDNNANITRYVYDQFGEETATIEKDDVPVSITLSQFSRLNNPNDTIPAPLNSSVTVSIQDSGKYYNFNDGDQVKDWTLINSSLNQSKKRIYLSNHPGSVALLNSYVSQKLNNSGIYFTVNLGNFTNHTKNINSSNLTLNAGSYRFSSQLSITNNNYIVYYFLQLDGTHNYTVADTVSNINNFIQQWAVLFSPNSVTWLVDGKVVFTITDFKVAATGSYAFSTNYNTNNVVWIENIIVFTDPLIENDHLDGEGKFVQSQLALENSYTTSQVLYDSTNNLYLETLPANLKSSLLYNPKFVKSFSYRTGQLKGDVQQGINDIDKITNDDQYYLYTQYVYENSPESKQIEEYRPGTYYSMMGEAYEHSKEGRIKKAVNWTYLHWDQISTVITYIGYAADLVNVIIEPENPLAWAFLAMDFYEIVHDELVAPPNPDAGFVPSVTSYYYDKKGRLVKISLPLANSGTDTSQVITYSYNFMGDMIKESIPESGTTRYAYDYSGNLRFTQSAGMGDTTIYIKYDKLGRQIEDGFFMYPWTDETQKTLEDNANKRNYPASSNNILTLQEYNDDNFSASSRNRLSRTVTNNKTGNVITETYNYDNPGNVISLQTKYSNPADSFTVRYGYTNLGNVKYIVYPEAANNFTVQYTYNKLGEISTVGTSSNPAAFASYNYNADGSIKSETLYKSTAGDSIQGVYKYSAPGYLTSINYPGLYKYEFNYNFAGWFDNFRNSPSYGSNIASAQYTPFFSGHKSPLTLSYNYDLYDNLSYYKNNGSNADNIRELNLTFNLDQNLAKISQQLLYTSSSLNYNDTYNYNTKLNRPLRLINSNSYNIDGSPTKYANDTIYADYYGTGEVKTLRSSKLYAHTSGFGENKDSIFYNLKRLFYSADGLTYLITNSDSARKSNTWNVGLNKTYFDYEDSGLRKQKSTEFYKNGGYKGKSIKRYIHGLTSLPLMEYCTSYSPSGQLTQKLVKCYIFGADGIIAMNTTDLINSQSNSYFILKDNLGSTLQILDRNKQGTNITASYSYSAFGKTDVTQSTNPEFFSYLYTGQEYDEETGLYNYKARLYDPRFKFFLSPDPMMDDPALPYAYAGNNPINYTDPSGGVPGKKVLKGLGKATKTGKTIKKTGGKTVKAASKTITVKKTSLRDLYLGSTPSKSSRTGRELLERTDKRGLKGIAVGTAPADNLPRAKWMGSGPKDYSRVNDWHVFVEVPVNPNQKFSLGDATTWNWVPLDEKVHMGHNPIDAVARWNSYLFKFGPKSNKAREFMLNPKSYEFEYGKINSARGAKLKTGYRSPLKIKGST